MVKNFLSINGGIEAFLIQNPKKSNFGGLEIFNKKLLTTIYGRYGNI